MHSAPTTAAKRADPDQIELLERLQAILDWCDLALANPDEFNCHGVKNLAGPVFDEARECLAAFNLAGSPQADAPASAMGAVDLEEACKPWEFYHGPVPDYESPLSGVFGAGMAYSEQLLAKFLDVDRYDGGDGSEDFDCDATMTLLNILTAAKLYDPENGRLATLAASTPKAPDEGQAQEWAGVTDGQRQAAQFAVADLIERDVGRGALTQEELHEQVGEYAKAALEAARLPATPAPARVSEDVTVMLDELVDAAKNAGNPLGWDDDIEAARRRVETYIAGLVEALIQAREALLRLDMIVDEDKNSEGTTTKALQAINEVLNAIRHPPANIENGE